LVPLYAASPHLVWQQGCGLYAAIGAEFLGVGMLIGLFLFGFEETRLKGSCVN